MNGNKAVLFLLPIKPFGEDGEVDRRFSDETEGDSAVFMSVTDLSRVTPPKFAH